MPDLRVRELLKRQYRNCSFYDDDYCYSGWDSWGRWVVLAIVVVGFALLFACCACITSRRRRRSGLQPYYGTGWMAPKPNNNQPHQFQPYPNTTYPQGPNPYGQYYPPAPPYTPAPVHAGYFASDQTGQQNGVYAPPPGPPPAHENPPYETQPPAGPPPAHPPPMSPPPVHTHSRPETDTKH